MSETIPLKYEVIASGSRGNAVVIGDVLIDVGIPFMKLRDHLYNVKTILVTHYHLDHINGNTVKAIRRVFPWIKWVGNFQVAQFIDIDMICNPGFPIVIGEKEFIPFVCPHGDVECTGFTWWDNGKRIIYATDTSSLDYAPDGPYDYLFLESNHDELKIKAIKEGRKPDQFHLLDGPLRHLSTQECKKFYYYNRRSRESKLIELHKSERFY